MFVFIQALRSRQVVTKDTRTDVCDLKVMRRLDDVNVIFSCKKCLRFKQDVDEYVSLTCDDFDTDDVELEEEFSIFCLLDDGGWVREPFLLNVSIIEVISGISACDLVNIDVSGSSGICERRFQRVFTIKVRHSRIKECEFPRS